MSIYVTSYSLAVGATRTLYLAQGEDREFRPTFTVSGTALDMTGATAVVATLRNRATGILVCARSYSGFQGAASAGTPRFQFLQADTVSQSPGAYDIDITWTDASGYKQQLQAQSTLLLLPATGQPTDPLTSPPAIPVVYGINWQTASPFWTSKSGGYQINDGVEAYDGSLGVTAVSTFRAVIAGVTYYPIGPTFALATGWQYVGQHGGAPDLSAATIQMAESPISAYVLLRASTSASGRLQTLGVADDAARAIYAAGATAAASGATFLAYALGGFLPVRLLSDGTTGIGNGDYIGPSTGMTGYVRGDATYQPLMTARSAAGATAGTSVWCQ